MEYDISIGAQVVVSKANALSPERAVDVSHGWSIAQPVEQVRQTI